MNIKHNNLENKLTSLIDSIESLFKEIPTLEVNTMIVDTIIPSNFIPEKIYQEIYEISEEYLLRKGINQDLWPSYLDLKNNLELEYLILHKNESKLPAPDAMTPLLSNSIWLQKLRKIGDIKQILDSRNQELINQEKGEKNTSINTIFAQTKINLDGVIINRYSQEIFNHSHKDIILEIHRDSVNSGQKQWRQLLQNIIELLQQNI